MVFKQDWDWHFQKCLNTKYYRTTEPSENKYIYKNMLLVRAVASTEDTEDRMFLVLFQGIWERRSSLHWLTQKLQHCELLKSVSYIHFFESILIKLNVLGQVKKPVFPLDDVLHTVLVAIKTFLRREVCTGGLWTLSLSISKLLDTVLLMMPH